MPIVSAVKKSPGGAPYVRAESHGQISLADAHGLMDPLRPGGAHHAYGLLAVVAAGSEFSPEARKVFGTSDPERNAKNVPTALVVSSAEGAASTTVLTPSGISPSMTRTSRPLSSGHVCSTASPRGPRLSTVGSGESAPGFCAAKVGAMASTSNAANSTQRFT